MASVLKSDSSDEKTSAARSVSGLAGFNLDDIADVGRNRLSQCRAEITQMLDKAKVEAKAIRAKASEKGYQEGLNRASVDAEKKLQAAATARAEDSLRLLQQSVAKLHTAHEQWMQEYAQTLTTLALSAAEKIVRRKLADEPELLVRWAEEALRSTRTASQLTLAVHPETLAVLGQSLDEVLASPDLPEQAHVVPDETLDRDAVVVRQTGGSIEAGLTAQLQRLEELLA